MILFAARVISFIFHPLFIAILATYLISNYSTHNLQASFTWTGVMVLIAVSIFLFELYGIRKGFFSDLDISKRQQRWPLFFFIFLIVSAFMISIPILGGPMALFVGGIYITVGIIVFSLVNRKIKASIHAGGDAAFFVSMALLYGGLTWLGLLCVPLIAWSRVKLRRHTRAEVIVGAFLGIILTLALYVVIQYFKLI